MQSRAVLEPALCRCRRHDIESIRGARSSFTARVIGRSRGSLLRGTCGPGLPVSIGSRTPGAFGRYAADGIRSSNKSFLRCRAVVHAGRRCHRIRQPALGVSGRDSQLDPMGERQHCCSTATPRRAVRASARDALLQIDNPRAGRALAAFLLATRQIGGASTSLRGKLVVGSSSERNRRIRGRSRLGEGDPAVGAWRMSSRAKGATRGIGSTSSVLVETMCANCCIRTHRVRGDAAFAYVNAFKAPVNVGFFRGAELATSGLGGGTGKYIASKAQARWRIEHGLITLIDCIHLYEENLYIPIPFLG